MKQKINRIRRRSGIVGILLLLILIMYVWIGFPKESRITAFDNEEVQDLQGSVYVSCNGEEIKTVLPGKITAKAGDTIVIRRKLDEDSVMGNTILFYCKQAHIRVYLDEERIWEDPDRSLPFPMLEGSYWRLIRMPASCEGKELRIEIVPQVNQYAGELPAIYTGTKASLVYMVARQGIVFLLLGLIAVILGVAILIMGLIMRHEGVIASRMCYLGLLAVITGIWGVLEARVTQLFTGIATIVGTFCFMLSVNVSITFVVVLITPVSFFVANFIAKRTFRMFRLQSEIRGEQTGLIDEMIGNQKVVQAFGRGEDATEHFDEVNKRLQEASLRATFFSSITNPATRFVNSLVYTGVGITGAFAVVRGAMSVGQLSSFLSYANQYTKPFNEISGVVTEFQNAIACAQRVFTLIDEEPQIPEPEHAVHLTDIDGNVKVEDVSFSYLPGQHLIEDFNLEVKPGQRIAIVGPTGCGKTTLINLLMRFYDVNAGSIKVEDIDIREMTRKSLRAGYGMVLQETWLKTGTIRENIAMGRPDATEEEIVEAAKASHIHNYIRRLPKGYDTWITEDGGGLSQGQKQLLCIARVMLCRPPMLILDEATSSIDTRTEIKIQQAFAKLMEGRTTFIVAHRLSTIREADVILVMKDGKIIEQGNHEVLMKKEGFYHHLYESQFSM